MDTYASLEKQFRMLKSIIDCYRVSLSALENNAELNDILAAPVREEIGRSKYIEEKDLAKFDKIATDIKSQLSQLSGKESF